MLTLPHFNPTCPNRGAPGLSFPSLLLATGIPPSKLIAGIPWYGYDYTCLPHTPPDARFCPIPQVGFRGVNCSDAAGTEVPFSGIMARLDSGGASTPKQWDDYLNSPYYNYVDTAGATHQVWYDDPESLRLKYAWIKETGLRGTGPFTFGDTDPTGEVTRNPRGHAEHAAMWDALRWYVGNEEGSLLVEQQQRTGEGEFKSPHAINNY